MPKGLTGLFDNERFFGPKKYQVTRCSEWKDYNTKAHLGTKIEVVILEDHTKYELTKTGEVINNQFEKLVIRVAKDVTIPTGTQVTLINPKATIYGQYLNQLSITADDVQPVTTKSNP